MQLAVKGLKMTKLYSGSEKRKHARYKWSAPVVLTQKDRQEESEIQNISMGGILVQSNLGLVFGDEVTVRFEVPKLDAPIIVNCTVRWIMEHDIAGLNFNALKAIETWAVSQLVRKLADEQE